MDARMMLEPQLAAQAAIHATAEDHEACQRCLSEMADTPTYLHWKRGDEKLHRLIAEAADNRLVLLMYDTLKSRIRASFNDRLAKVFGGDQTPRRTDEEHSTIIEAICAGDPQAAEHAMREHLVRVRIRLFGLR